MKKMLRVFNFVAVLTLLFCFFPTAMPVSAQAVTVSINAPTQVVTGGSFTATIAVDNVTNFDAAQYDVTFNPAQLSLVNITAGDIGGTSIPIALSVNLTAGTCRIINNLLGPYSESDIGVSGSGYLATLHFNVIGPAGQSGNIELTDGMLSNYQAQSILSWVYWGPHTFTIIKNLVRIEVTPPGSLALGRTRQFTAAGFYSDNTSENITTNVTWTSSNTSIATIESLGQSNPGLAHSLAQGQVTISANFTSITGSTTLTVNPKVLDSIAVVPSAQTIPLGRALPFSAIGTYSDNSTANLTTNVNWTSSNTTVATIGPGTGLAQSLAQGQTVISATNNTTGVTGNTTLAVGPKVLDTIDITPANPVRPSGRTIQFTAKGIYSDSSNTTLTCNWTSSNPAVATIGLNTGLAVTSNYTGWTTISAQYGEVIGNTKLTIISAVPDFITITPVNPTNIAQGTTIQFTATGFLSNGSTANVTAAANWTSSNPAIATIGFHTGLAIALTADTTNITASWGGKTDTTSLTVDRPAKKVLVITPPNPTVVKDSPLQLTATIHYTSGNPENVTPSAIWSSSNTAVATINTGLITALTAGTTNITATWSGKTGTTLVNVIGPTLESAIISPETPTVVAGNTTQLTLTGTLSDNNTVPLTSIAIWSSSNPSVAKIGPTGLVEGHKIGTSNITAYYGGLRDWVLLTVTSPTTTLSPAVVTGRATDVTHNSAILNGYLLSLGSATSVNVSFEWGLDTGYGNETTPQAMTSADAFNIRLTGLSPGTPYHFRAKATDNSTAPVMGIDQTFTTKKQPPSELVSIQVSRTRALVAAGETSQFSANGTYSDGSSVNITALVAWSSSDKSVASVSNTGLATGHSEGVATITATRSGVSGSANLSVTSEEIATIQVYPHDPTIRLGGSQPFKAVGIYTNQKKSDVTTSVNWTGSDIGVAEIGLNTGLATTVNKTAGWTLITAQFGSISGTSNLTSTAGTLESITVAVIISPVPLIAGDNATCIATGNFSGTPGNIIGLVTWSSSDNTIAKVAPLGLVTTYAPGTVTISATYGGVTGSANLTVNSPEIRSIIVTPKNSRVIHLPENPPQIQFTATAISSDRSTRDVTNLASWTSQNAGVATIGLNTGTANTTGHGATKITATWNSPDGNVEGFTNLTVLPDKAAPRATLNSPTEGLILTSRGLTVSGDIDDRYATANLTINGNSRPLSLSSEGSFDTRVLLDFGRNSVRVDAVDQSGNVGTTGTVTVLVSTNTEIPVITVTQPASGSVTNNSSVTITGTITGTFTSPTLTFNGIQQAITEISGSFSVPKTLVNGINTIVVNAYAAGRAENRNYLGTSGVITVTLDTTGPRITIDSPPTFGGIIGNAGIEVTGKIDDPKVSSARLTLNKGTSNEGAPQLIEVVGGNFSQSITLPLLGTNTITIEASDAAGNTGSAVASVTIDNTYPQVIVTSPVNGLVTNVAAQAISGKVDDPTIANVTVRRAPPSTGSSVGAGDVTSPETLVTIPVMPDGSFSGIVTMSSGIYEVTATDTAGHTGSSGWMRIEIDNTSPVIAIHVSDPTDFVVITVTSNEALNEIPTVSLDSISVNIAETDVKEWSGAFAPVVAGQDCNVSVNATDKAGNKTTSSATFTKEAITVDGISATTVTTSTASLEVETNGAVSGNISITNHQSNPSGDLNPEGASHPVGVFLEIVASTELVNNLKQIHILAEYNPDELPEGTDNETLKIYLWEAVSGMWEEVSNSGPVDIGNRHYIEGYIDHLSKYGTFGAQTGGGGPTSSGGGGGGGGGSTIIITLGGLATTANMEVDSNGVIFKTSRLQTIDQKVTLDIIQGTKLLNNEGTVLKTLSASKVAAPPASPSGQTVVQSYQFGPDGTRFEPAINLTMSYDPAALPQGAAEKEVYIGYWDNTKWAALPSMVNSEADTVSANVSHFTQFAVIAKLLPQPTPQPEQPPAPAEFKLTDLLINPAEAISGSPVAISIVLNNTGGSEGNYTVVLKINGTEEDRENITLKAGEQEAVTFTVTKEKEGSYAVSISDLSGQLTVTAAPQVTPPTPKSGLHWPLVISIAGGVLILGLILWFTVFRRRAW